MINRSAKPQNYQLSIVPFSFCILIFLVSILEILMLEIWVIFSDEYMREITRNIEISSSDVFPIGVISVEIFIMFVLYYSTEYLINRKKDLIYFKLKASFIFLWISSFFSYVFTIFIASRFGEFLRNDIIDYSLTDYILLIIMWYLDSLFIHTFLFTLIVLLKLSLENRFYAIKKPFFTSKNLSVGSIIIITIASVFLSFDLFVAFFFETFLQNLFRTIDESFGIFQNHEIYYVLFNGFIIVNYIL